MASCTLQLFVYKVSCDILHSMNTHVRVVFFFLALVLMVGGGGTLLEKGFLKSVEERAGRELASGDYLASVIEYNKLKEHTDGVLTPEIQHKIEEAEKLLIAEANFNTAKKAAEEGDWLKVRALLTGEATMINTSFTQYEEAIELYIKASEKVKNLEEKIGTELASLKDEALTEKTKREKAEEQVSETKNTLQTTIAEKERKETQLIEQITVAEKGKAEAEQKALAERNAKFANELNLYLGMLEKGNGYLSSALAEIEALKDGPALSYVSDAKSQFTEVNTQGNIFLSERTPEEFKSHTQKLLQASALLTDASRYVGSLVSYMDIKDGEEYKKFFAGAKERRQTAVSLINELRVLVSSL